jgi:hypothetical protein
MRLQQLIAAAGLLVAAATTPRAQTLEAFDARLSLFAQDGSGRQSADGSEQATIVEPIVRALLRTGEVTHDAVLDVDVVSAASPDAVDAMSSASRVNVSIGLDVTSRFPTGGALRWGAHVEEPLRSLFLGGGLSRGFAEDNTVLAVSALATWDFFDLNRHDATVGGIVTRATLNANATLRQILSPTTRGELSYGYTLQSGVLETTFNSVPLDDGGRGAEVLPRRRGRHALAAALAQMLPATRSVARASYRFYADDFGLVAHTAELRLVQRLGGALRLGGGYRHHHQSGVDFYADRFARGAPGPRTADSDLARFTARQLDVELTWLRGAEVGVSCARYWRDNGLTSLIVALDWSQRF